MSLEEQSYLRGSLSQSVVEFFRDYGVDCHTDDLPPPSATEDDIASVIGFRGDNIDGGLVFVAPESFVAETLPIPVGTERIDRRLRDWTREIANQLAGRLNNKLCSRALDFDVGTAASLRGIGIRGRTATHAPVVCLGFTVGAVGVRVYLDCSLLVDAALGESDSSPIAREGDVILF